MNILAHLDKVLTERKKNSYVDSYVNQLYSKGIDAILKKIAEESGEVIMAAKDLQHDVSTTSKENLIYEVADLWFHSMILLHHNGISSQDILAELQKREGTSGILEKQNRQ